MNNYNNNIIINYVQIMLLNFILRQTIITKPLIWFYNFNKPYEPFEVRKVYLNIMMSIL